jgi:hypothetical protein
MAVIGARELQPVNLLGQYVQGLEAGRQAQAQRKKEAQAAQLQNMLMGATPEQLQSPDFINRLIVTPGGAEFAKPLMETAAARGKIKKEDLEQRRAGFQLIADLSSSAVDEPSYQTALARLNELGVDTSSLPPTYDPDYVATQQRLAMTAAQRLDAELRERTAEVQERQIGLREREFERGAAGGGGRAMPAPPQGYRYTAAGDLEPIPGGPKDPKVVGESERVKISSREAAKRDATFSKVNQSYKSHSDKADDLVKLLTELKEAKGLPQLLGPIESRLPTFRQDTADAEAKLKTILARGQFRELQEMRNNSPTGGALGNVSNFEIQALQNAFAQLDTAQSEASFKRAVDRVVEELNRSKRNLKEAFEDTYGYRENRAGATDDGNWEDL